MRLRELGEGCLKVPASLQDLSVRGLTCDSREVRPGYCFVAVRGEAADGHRYVQAAEAAGAVVVVGDRPRHRRADAATSKSTNTGSKDASHVGRSALPVQPVAFPDQPAAFPDQLPVLPDQLSGDQAEKHSLPKLHLPYFRVADARRALGQLGANFYGHPARSLQVVGITGTKGKTTTAWVLDTILRVSGRVCGLFGTVHNRIDSEVFPTINTTPSSLEFHRLFRELVDRGGTHAVLEVSSHGIVQKRTAGFHLEVGIFTNIAPEHLDYHKTFEDYLDAKAQLFRDLRLDAYAVLPREEPGARRMQRESRAQTIWYGMDPQDGVEQVRMGPEGTSFRWKGREVFTHLWGYHNLLNVLGAMVAAECLGLTVDEIIAGVAVATAPPGRLEEIPHPRNFRVLIDYAHTDGSLETVLKAVRSVTSGRVITIFGCGGDRDRTKRPRMGRVAEAGSDYIVVTSDNPRCEEPDAIIQDILGGLEHPDDAVFEPDRRAAIALAIRMAQPNDTVLIAGKGHETYQEFQNKRVEFNDREVAREFLLEGIGGALS